jgi:hypothetical protein
MKDFIWFRGPGDSLSECFRICCSVLSPDCSSLGLSCSMIFGVRLCVQRRFASAVASTESTMFHQNLDLIEFFMRMLLFPLPTQALYVAIGSDTCSIRFVQLMKNRKSWIELLKRFYFLTTDRFFLITARSLLSSSLAAYFYCSSSSNPGALILLVFCSSPARYSTIFERFGISLKSRLLTDRPLILSPPIPLPGCFVTELLLHLTSSFYSSSYLLRLLSSLRSTLLNRVLSEGSIWRPLIGGNLIAS